MQILIVNDDGIEYEGIHILAELAKDFGTVTVVAPMKQCSAMSHRVSIDRDQCIRKCSFPVEGCEAYAFDGTPADCVKAAIGFLHLKPDYVFSGINDGINAGFDIAYSGTIGAAMEALMLGIPAIAYSRLRRGDADYGTVRACFHDITAGLLKEEPPGDSVRNINFPNCPADQCRGVLYDRRIAPQLVIPDTYHLISQTGDDTVVKLSGHMLDASAFAEGTDLRAVLDNYVSVGDVRCPVL
uniref:5'/3'-nucleotidase SurE n=1 Tax=Eubacterium cellulosolvens TaxID=29322 RepID=UPI0004897725|nr:5'/3'-nucleotidase SurE [[Eubacterium] cellulosolvens]